MTDSSNKIENIVNLKESLNLTNETSNNQTIEFAN